MASTVMENSVLLSGKIALITGGGSPRGIGRATARLFAREGAMVAILDLDAASAEDAAMELGSDHIGLGADITKADDVTRAVDQIVQRFGRVDILFNNAGITQPLKVLEIRGSDYDRVLDVSLRGSLIVSQAIVPSMKASQRGSIICMSSVSAQRGGGVFGGPHYSAAKAAVLGLARAMARELGPDGIRVNSIAPGLIETDITQGKLSDDRRRNIIEGIPLGRLGSVDDVANAALYLASDMSSYLTGVTLDVNGGMLIH